ncbi:hypothetical protein GCM10019059_32870 [Camelimonas fluminis]|uniref:Uncharacterized protein n=1 Tax=Camelimonas fluminis TaxID=1576911 RepID=A0ABV7UFR6_9HYPH|nr:hypothetical protein [Camelimonas fluminis]GHE70547.1 hypothetical protein GCM10019059_32870 [Camelimonas fluminis]
MADSRSRPALIARRIAARRDQASQQGPGEGPPAAASPPSFHDASHDAASVVNLSAWRRECFTLPPAEARETARDWLARYPRARWRSEIENWRIVGDNLVQFTMRRLPQAE